MGGAVTWVGTERERTIGVTAAGIALTARESELRTQPACCAPVETRKTLLLAQIENHGVGAICLTVRDPCGDG